MSATIEVIKQLLLEEWYIQAGAAALILAPIAWKFWLTKRKDNQERRQALKLDSLVHSRDSAVLALTLANIIGYNSPIAMWAKDLQGRRLYHNPAWLNMMGLQGHDSSRFIGMRDHEIAQVPEDHPAVSAWRKFDEQVVRENKTLDKIEAIPYHPTGDLVYVWVVKWPLKRGPYIIGTEGACVPLKYVEDAWLKHRKEHGVDLDLL